MNDEMTSKERIKAAVKFEEHDRVPVFPLTHWGVPGLFGISVEEYTKNPEVQAKCDIDACKQIGYDGINVGVDVIIEAEAFEGSKTRFSKDGPPFLIAHPLGEDKNKLYNLKIKNPETSGRMATQIKTAKIVVDEVGKDTYILAWIMGPLNCASQLRGVQDTVIDFVLDTKYLEDLLDFATEQVLVYGRSLARAGVDCIGIGEALASPSFSSPESISKYVFPRYKKLISGLHEEGVDTLIHICGDIYPIFDYGDKIGKNLFTQEAGTDIVDIDWEVDMKDAIERTGLCCRGNLNPSDAILSGTKEKVLADAKKVILNAGPTKGLILGSGCDCSYYTPKENYRAMVEASKKWGVYPISENF